MSIAKAFQNGKAFIPFVTMGDPDLETSKEILLALEKAGADLIELGIPFSDPTAEGEVIENANARALKGGVTTDKIFQMLEEFKLSVPLVFMTYANVVFSYGIERFAKRCQDVGVCGLILPDVPFEEKDEFASVCRLYGVELVSLVAPTSEQRIEEIAKSAEGFLYLVSSMGVTGVRQNITTNIDAMVTKARIVTDIPLAIGFGISTPEQARNMAQKADGAIIGSAIMKIVEEHKEASPKYIYEYALSVKSAINEIV